MSASCAANDEVRAGSFVLRSVRCGLHTRAALEIISERLEEASCKVKISSLRASDGHLKTLKTFVGRHMDTN